MKKLFVVSVVFLVIGVGCLGAAFYLYRIHGQTEPVAGAGISEGVLEGEADTRVVYKRPERVDRSTPDKAIQSYWEYVDYVRSAKRDPGVKRYTESRVAFDRYLEKMTPIEQPFLEVFCARELLEERLKSMRELSGYDMPIDPRKRVQVKYRRVIQEVKFESDTRAKVECRVYNVTPIENLKQLLTEEETKARKHGRDFTYTVEKFPDGWKIIDKKWSDEPEGLFGQYFIGDEAAGCYYVDDDDN